MKVRDTKTGRFAESWKAQRWPERFKKIKLLPAEKFPVKSREGITGIRKPEVFQKFPAMAWGGEPGKIQRIRDRQTGRFVSAWKAERWPDRFGIGPGPFPRQELREIFRDYASEGTLLRNFDWQSATFARDRLNKNLYIIELRARSGKGSISFSINLKTGEVHEEKGYKKKGKKHR